MEEKQTKRSKGSGSFRSEQSRLKTSGKSYKTYKKKIIPEKSYPKEQITCKCNLSCKDVSYERKRTLFEKYYAQDNVKTQSTFLMGLISICDVQRRRHGSYEDEQNSRRQATICYSLPDGQGKCVRVCKKTFQNTFDVNDKKVRVLIEKKKMGETCYNDKRTRHAASKFSEADRRLVKDHINMIPREVGHYSRVKSEKEYLSPDLNIHRLFKAFTEIHSDSLVTYKFYRSVFTKDFPNLCFHRPRVDTCSTCDRLHCEVKANIESSQSAKVQLDIHHRKAERAREILKQDTIESQDPESTKCCLSMDLQQLSCYNLGVHIGDTNTAYMCMWHEGVASRGANEIASCLLYIVNRGLTLKKHLVIWCDNCGGQNKNRILLFTLIFLAANGVFETIEQKFLVSGHSFMPCDRDFALIEQRKKVTKAHVPSDLHAIVRSARYTPPFQVIDMIPNGFWDLKRAADEYINTTKLNISKATVITIEATNPAFIKIKTTYSDLQEGVQVNVLKKGRSLDGLRHAIIMKLPSESNVSENKKVSLRSMIPYLQSAEHQRFYKQLLNIEDEGSDEQKNVS
ncbi:hypothetical protein RI129_003362 [Pyrocoelia pectoralis]|uniref:DUF7869 domain-containing protein n=1 Tax=Pyrocoelia pectoralis TaxID=417401 RepID=A0AAN7ZIK4_9COLE